MGQNKKAVGNPAWPSNKSRQDKKSNKIKSTPRAAINKTFAARFFYPEQKQLKCHNRWCGAVRCKANDQENRSVNIDPRAGAPSSLVGRSPSCRATYRTSANLESDQHAPKPQNQTKKSLGTCMHRSDHSEGRQYRRTRVLHPIPWPMKAVQAGLNLRLLTPYCVICSSITPGPG